METGHGRPLDYQPGEYDWAQVLSRMDGILRLSGQARDSKMIDVTWDSDELQKRFTLSRWPLDQEEKAEDFRYLLRIEEMFSGQDDSTIMVRSDMRGIGGVLGPICDEVDTGLSGEPIENAELLLRLYLSSYTMGNNV